METRPATDLRIWVLADPLAGTRSQVFGVADALGLPYETKEITYGPLAMLPNFMLGPSILGASAETRARLVAPWPDVVLAAGRRTAPLARYIKRQSVGQTRLVQIMDPAGAREEFDLIAAPAHDQVRGPNVFTVPAAPHRITPSTLKAARDQWRDALQPLPSPRIALIIGGSTKNKRFSVEMAKDLSVMANTAALSRGGSILLTTSRRSDKAATDAVLAEVTVPHHRFVWGDEGDNPYFGYLAWADAVIVTGESVSMVSEACASGKPVHLYAPRDLISKKHARLHAALYEAKLAHPFNGMLEGEAAPPFNAADDIAIEIRKRFHIQF